MTITKNANGSYSISEIINGYLKTITYYFTTKKQAVDKFMKKIKS